ncbi:MAG: hypothetical protein PHY54_17580 [Methylococcales bacterium]|nr:hypothetical protein [Methylococcales bacterium]
MNTNHFKHLTLLAILIIQNGCAERPVKEKTPPSVSETALQKQYHEALEDAAIVDEIDISDKLLAITLDNPELVWNKDKTRVLVVTWKTRKAYEDYIKNNPRSSSDPNYAIWVTAAPEVKAFCQNYLRENPMATNNQLDLRLKQYLGLPPDPDQKYDVFVELWVSPENIFRPCVDPEINDNKCNLKIPGHFPSVANIPDYGAFYQALYFNRFRRENRYPWTGVGYTYDWNKDDHQSKVGASEFILIPDTPYKIERDASTREYCQ